MSKVNKRKHYQLELDKNGVSTPSENQQIVRCLRSRGNNIHEVQSPDNSVFLVIMPSKFRKFMWLRRGGYIVVEALPQGKKVKAEIVRILNQEDINYFKEENVWPYAVNNQEASNENTEVDITINPNKPQYRYPSDTDSSEESSESSSDESLEDSSEY